MDEFLETTGKDFYIYSTHSFLKLANEHLHQHTSPAAVEEVRDSFINEKQLSILERDLSSPEDDTNEVAVDNSASRKYDMSYYQREELLIAKSITQMDLVIQNLRDKLSEAELLSSPSVVTSYKERLGYSLRMRKSLRMKQRYYARRTSQMLNDDLI